MTLAKFRCLVKPSSRRLNAYTQHKLHVKLPNLLWDSFFHTARVENVDRKLRKRNFLILTDCDWGIPVALQRRSVALVMG